MFSSKVVPAFLCSKLNILLRPEHLPLRSTNLSPEETPISTSGVMILLYLALLVSFPLTIHPQSFLSESEKITASDQGNTTSLKELVPDQYLKSYNRWKEALLSVEVGRQLWKRYAANPSFHLTIIVSRDQGEGAKVTDYRWESGKLIAATITLGSKLSHGYPGQFCYPVLGSLALVKSEWGDGKDNVLAAAKIAHELGHVDQTANADPNSYKLQNELLGVYNSHFVANGYNTDDPVLKDLVGLIGGTPADVSRDREYWAETYSLRYLLDKSRTDDRRQLLKLVRKYIQSEAQISSLPSQIEWDRLTSGQCEVTADVNCVRLAEK
jgi:hypothetical protein